jgi:hypothetical protein
LEKSQKSKNEVVFLTKNFVLTSLKIQKKMAKIIFTLDFTFYPVWLCDEGNMYIKGSNIRH